LDALLNSTDDDEIAAASAEGWRTISELAVEWNMSDCAVRDRLKFGVQRGLVEVGRRKIRRSNGAIYSAAAYRMKT
jgi:hypothetical protein